MNNGKSSSGCLIFMLLVALAGYITYNEIRIRQLNENLAAASSKVGAKPSASKVKDLVEPLVSGREHALRAQKFLKDKKYDQAEDELTKAVSSLKEAQDSAEEMYGGAKGFLGNARDAATSAIRKTREGIGGLTRKGKEPQKKGEEKR